VGETPEDARAVMVAAGWKPEIVLVRRDGTEAGQVIGSDPVPGTRLASGRTVKITVSQGPTVVDVPADLAGRSRDQAVFTLGAVGLTGDVVDERYDEQVAKGVVIALAGGTASKLEKGSTVALVVSKGPLPRKVPSGLAGSTVPAATQALADMQLKIATDPTASETAPQGEVISVTPDPGAAVARDSVVTAKVSTGPSPRTVPRGLQGSTVPAATQKLADVQLEIATISNFNDTVAQGKIVSVAPAPGKTLPPGSVVTVEVSKGPELVAVPDVGQADSVSEAIALLDAKGLKAGSLSGPAAGSPQGTRPGAGSLVRPGATVDLVLG
ncbi:MAG: PASTA domain-containing protein, partial [Acidimicrobiales bacterium]